MLKGKWHLKVIVERSISRECEQGWNRSGMLLQNSEIVLMWMREMFLKKDPSFFVSGSPVYMVYILYVDCSSNIFRHVSCK